MNGKTYAYLDIAILPPVGAVLLDPRPAFVFRADGSAILWANAAGVAFFGEATMGALLARRLTADSPLARQMAKLAKQLPTDHDRLEALRFSFGINQETLPAACRRLVLAGGGSAVLAIGATAAPRESLSTRAERLADAIAGDDCLAAIIDADGKVLGASGGFDELAPTSAEIDALIAEVDRGERRLLKRPLAVTGGVRPSGAARVTIGTERLFLLIVGPVEEAAATAPEVVPAAAEPATPAPPPHTQTPPSNEPHPAATAAAPETGAPVVSLRFLWQLDRDLRFTFVSEALGEIVGPDNAPLLGESWLELNDRLALDRDDRVAEALARQASWSGVPVYWPIAAAAERIAVDLSALPVTARDRSLAGFRGFGLVRPDDRRPDERPASTPVALPEPAAAVSEPASVVEPPPALEAAKIESAADEPLLPVATEVPPTVGPPPAAEKPAPPPPAAAGEEDFDEVARRLVEQGSVARAARQAGEPAEPPAAPKEAPRESNVVRLPGAPKRILAKRLSGTEQDAFRRIAEALGARNDNSDRDSATEPSGGEASRPSPEFDIRLLDRLPVGIVVYRDGSTLFANRSALDLLGYPTLPDFIGAGGAGAIFPEPGGGKSGGNAADGALEARGSDGAPVPVEAKLHAVNWSGATALMLSLLRRGALPEPAAKPAPAAEPAPAISGDRVAELEAILDTATDGVIVIDDDGLIRTFNRSAEALFGVGADAVTGKPFTTLLADESRRAALDYLDGLKANGVASVLNDGREVIGKVPAGGLIPLFMTMGRLGDSGKYCAVLRDITHWKNVEDELVAARRAAEAANAQKSEFLAKISHEIRTPLNAIIGFSEVMIEEQFGPVGNDRYRDYLRDIHVSGEHLMSLINDLLDLSKIEAGKIELNSEAVAVNDVIQECVALMQPQANRERIIIRTSLAADVPDVVADLRSFRQILLNLLSNAIKFTRAGGQVIVATALEESGEVVVRVRDTGIGMSEKEIETAMKPFRQVATSGRAREGTGLGLPLTKALVEANRATFAIDSVPDQGTLVRITFPTTRVLTG